MKLNKPQSNRTLHATEDGEGFILIERERFQPAGYVKAKWDEQRVYISREELLSFVQRLTK